MIPAVPHGAHDGALLDVSAGGVRVGLSAEADLKPDDPVRVEIALGHPDLAEPQRVRLTGRGVVVRVATGSAGGQDVAVHFEAPLAFLDRFPAIQVF